MVEWDEKEKEEKEGGALNDKGRMMIGSQNKVGLWDM